MPDYRELLDQMIDEIDAETAHRHRIELSSRADDLHNYRVPEATAYLQGMTDAHNRVRRIAQKYADQLEERESPT